jgi:crotonobetainyl-CoA:carnitine CoA-transferase CaiB-like acyl-CoA transferase
MRVEIGAEPTGPLTGVRVVELSTIVSGPLCGQILGDFGADVIKIETAQGDSGRYMGGSRSGDISGFFAQVNRNKRSVVLDLKTESGARALLRLVARADVLLENFRPGVLDRLGLGYDILRKENPRLVYAAISGFGPDGPYADHPAYDMVIQAMSGIAKIIGSPEQPRLVSNLLADKTAGINAALAISAALYARERSGEGQRIEIPMLDTFGSFVHLEQIAADAFGPAPDIPGLSELLFRAWQTTDGHVAVVLIEDHQFAAFCKIVRREEMTHDERFSTLIGRMQNPRELIGFMQAELQKLSTAEVLRRAHEYGAPVAAVNDLGAFLTDPQVVSSGLVFELDHPGAGPVRVLRSAPRFSRTPSDVRRPAPGLGAHTSEVLRDAGLSEAEIAELVGEG